jgi:hypothetical protein
MLGKLYCRIPVDHSYDYVAGKEKDRRSGLFLP